MPRVRLVVIRSITDTHSGKGRLMGPEADERLKCTGDRSKDD